MKEGRKRGEGSGEEEDETKIKTETYFKYIGLYVQNAFIS